MSLNSHWLYQHFSDLNYFFWVTGQVRHLNHFSLFLTSCTYLTSQGGVNGRGLWFSLAVVKRHYLMATLCCKPPTKSLYALCVHLLWPPMGFSHEGINDHFMYAVMSTWGLSGTSSTPNHFIFSLRSLKIWDSSPHTQLKVQECWVHSSPSFSALWLPYSSSSMMQSGLLYIPCHLPGLWLWRRHDISRDFYFSYATMITFLTPLIHISCLLHFSSSFFFFFLIPGPERGLSSSFCSIKTTFCIILYSVQFYSFWINFILSFLALNPTLTQKAQLLLIKLFGTSNLYSQI